MNRKKKRNFSELYQVIFLRQYIIEKTSEILRNDLADDVVLYNASTMRSLFKCVIASTKQNRQKQQFYCTLETPVLQNFKFHGILLHPIRTWSRPRQLKQSKIELKLDAKFAAHNLAKQLELLALKLASV